MKNLARLILINVIFPWQVALAQEISYIVSGELNSQKVSIDSILFENLSNNTSLWFKNLPVQQEYIINLTLKKLEFPTGVYPNKFEEPYKILKNVPGYLSISCALLYNENVTISVYNLQGQKLYTSESMPVNNGNTVNVILGKAGVYLVRIMSKTGLKTFKAIGSPSGGNFNVSVGQAWSSDFSGNKKLKNMNGDNFSFIPGDQLRVSVYKDACYTRPYDLVIGTSLPIRFILKQSMVESYGVSDAFKIISKEMQDNLIFDTETGEIRLPIPESSLIPKVGEIIAIDYVASGFLRRIVGLAEVNGELTLQSRPAYLNEVFVDIDLKLNTSFREPQSPLKKSSSPGEIISALTDEKGYIHPVEVFYNKKAGPISRKSAYSSSGASKASVPLINFLEDLSGQDIYGSSLDDVHFYISEGEVSLKSDAVFDLDFKSNRTLDPQTKARIGDLQRFSYYLDSKAGFRAKLALDLNSSFTFENAEPQKLLDLIEVTAKFMVPPGIPVWITFNSDIYGNYNFSSDASLNADWGFEKNDSLKVGGTYTDSTGVFIPYSEYWPHNTVYPLNLNGELNATARFELFPRVDVKFYDFIGPYAEIVPYVSGYFNSARLPIPGITGSENFLAWNSGINLGLDLRVGAELSFLGLLEKNFGPEVIQCFELPLWKAPEHLSSLTTMPGNVDKGSMHTLKYKVTDALGLPVFLCPVSFSGDGTFSAPITQTDSTGTASIAWTAQNSSGSNTINIRLYKADQSVIASDIITVTVGQDSITTDIVYDIEGNKYKTIRIGGKEWMAQNLKTTTFNDGTAIPQIIGPTEWNNSTTPGYCWFNNNMYGYKDIYGALYNWYAVNTGKLCPSGWHVPSDNEWSALVDYAGGYSQAAIKLKEAGTDHWIGQNESTNETGFTALPAGGRAGTINNGFQGLGYYAYFWSSTQSQLNPDWVIEWYITGFPIRIDGIYKFTGLSVRCVKGQ